MCLLRTEETIVALQPFDHFDSFNWKTMICVEKKEEKKRKEEKKDPKRNDRSKENNKKFMHLIFIYDIHNSHLVHS